MPGLADQDLEDALWGGHGEGLVPEVLHGLDGQVEVEPIGPDESSPDDVVQHAGNKSETYIIIFIYLFIYLVN